MVGGLILNLVMILVVLWFLSVLIRVGSWLFGM